MKFLLILLLMHGVLGHYRFGESYLENSLLCKPWVCINQQLNLDAPPTPARYAAALKSRLPPEWHGVVDSVVGLCSAVERPRAYTNTCPGQAMLHCVVDNLIEKCPESRLRKDDACAPLSSLAGFKYMFSQSRYENLEKYLPTERRPLWFLKNYFSTKCCDLPQIFDGSVLSECGFNSLIHYYGHLPKPKINFLPVNVGETKPASPSTPSPNYDKVRVVETAEINPTSTSRPSSTFEAVRVVDVAETDDLMSCCDLSHFVPPPARADCNFATSWDAESRLTVLDREPNPGAYDVTTTTTQPPPPSKHHDVKVVPLNCQSEICVFAKLNISSSDGKVNKDAFSKLLDKWTKEHPEWMSAKARVVTKCLIRELPEYKTECELNAVLGCVFDVLSENCPSNKRTVKDPCKHVHDMKDDTICRISASKYRPKNRRLFCDFPSFVPHTALAQCDVSSVYRIESVPEVSFRKPAFTPRFWNKPVTCKETMASSLCLMSKMGVLNKYRFMDYFKMKDRIRQLAANEEWAALSEVYMSSFNSMPLYRDHCASQRKLLNVVDAMIMTCPMTKRQNTPKCNKMFEDMAKNYTDFYAARAKIDQMQKQMLTKLFPTTTEKNTKTEENKKKMHPLLGYGMFGGKTEPKIEIIPIKPQIMSKENRKPLIVLPVYSRTTIPPRNTENTPTDETPEYDTTTQESPSEVTPENTILYVPKPGYPVFRHLDGLINVLDRYRFPRQFPYNSGTSNIGLGLPYSTPNPFYGPFHQDALLRGGVHFERPFTNGHSGNELGVDMVEPE